MRRLVLGTVAGVVGAAVLLGGVVAAEIQYARTRERLPTDPGFGVDVRAGSAYVGDELRVVMLGDSLVAGVGASSAEASLGGQVADQLARELERPVHLVGYGVSGAITSEVLDEQLDQVPEGIDVILVEVGSNDVTHRTGLDELERDTERLLRGARERADLVVFASAGKLNAPIFQQPLRAIVAARATKVRERQRAVASDLDVPFIDIAREVSPAYDDAAPESSSSDRFHPSDLGYEIWARPLAATVARAVESQ